ncbi:putative ABC transport system permease protein [Marininema mesophilum]|uniref:Putative ABC transport system permease protein n=1 Tax=Marininema mesophilum TaxID=1048340 RepID=A0A1H3D1A8_9BACL|nr:ABC transporter permease [Marininema mesophilum]SDX60126.1 putative ABC transport system permease protein [Marininema mesophilum]
MNFRQFAFNNVRRNARAYSAYFLSSTFAVMIFFTYAIFIFHPDLAKTDLGATTKQGMVAAEYVIFVFSFLFVLYSIGAFLKVRKKEFGMLTILGSEGKQLNRLIFLENMIIGSASILTGLVSGLILSKLFLLLGARVAEMKELSFYLPWKAMALTTVCFLALFFVISLLTLFFVRQNRVLELIKGSSKPKSEPKASIWLSLLSVACFVGAGYLMKQKLSETQDVILILILLLGIIATYFFFTQLSIFIIRLFKKNRPFFWRGTNLLWVSEMAYKVKDNARMFFIITIVIAMSCSVIGIILTQKEQNEQQFKESKFAYIYSVFQNDKGKFDFNQIKKDTAKMEQELKQAGIQYKKVRHLILYSGTKEMGPTEVIKESDYNRLAGIYNAPKVSLLKSNETILISSSLAEGKGKTKLTMEKDKARFTIKKQIENKGMARFNNQAVISNSAYEKLKKILPSDGRERINVSYYVPEWSNKIPNSNSLETKIGQKEVEISMENMKKGESSVIFESRANDYIQNKQSMSITSFIGVFIAAIFSLSTASFLYFKLYADLNQDRHLVYSLSRMGLSTKEMKRSATIQIAALFFIPLVVAGMETLIGLFLLKEQLSLGEPLIPALMGIGSFFTVQVVYFLIVRSRYLAQLNRVMV